MLKIEHLIDINKKFGDGEIEKIEALNDSILKINQTENWVEQTAFLMKSLVAENCFKDNNKETAALLLMTALESKRMPIHQDKILNLILIISKNKIVDLRRIKRLLIEAI